MVVFISISVVTIEPRTNPKIGNQLDPPPIIETLGNGYDSTQVPIKNGYIARSVKAGAFRFSKSAYFIRNDNEQHTSASKRPSYPGEATLVLTAETFPRFGAAVSTMRRMHQAQNVCALYRREKRAQRQ
jgi:hypothetical protein